LGLDDIFKLIGLIVVFLAAIAAVYKENVEDARQDKRARHMLLAIAIAGLIAGIGAQIYDSVKAAIAAAEEEKYRHTVVDKLVHVTDDLVTVTKASTSVHRLTFICFFDEPVKEEQLKSKEDFNLTAIFKRGNKAALRVYAATIGSEDGHVDECGHIDIAQGAFARSRIWKTDTTIQATFEAFGHNTTSFWICLWPDELTNRAYQERQLWLDRQKQSEWPEKIDWPYNKIGDFMNTPLYVSAQGRCATNLQLVILRINDNFVVELPIKDSYGRVVDVFEALKNVDTE
jgi:hypothetical protein